MARSTGKVRAARLTDLAALGELSRLAQADGEGTRSLGLPVTGPRIGMFSLFRLPARRVQPQRRDVRLRPRRARGRPAARGARQPARRVDGRRARRRRRHGRGRRALPAGPAPAARRRQARRGPVPRRLRRRATTTSSCSCRRASSGSATSTCCSASRRTRSRRRSPRRRHGPRGSGRRRRIDAVPLSRLYASVTPAPVQRLEAVPPPRLGAPGPRLAGAAQLARADPAVRRRRRLRAGVRGRRQGRHAARRVRAGRRRQGGPAALPQGDGPPGGVGRAAHPLRARRDRGARRRLDARTARACSPPFAPTSRPSTAGSKRRASPRSRPSRC